MQEDITRYGTISSLKQYKQRTDITYDKLFLKTRVPNNSSEDLIINYTPLLTKYKEYIMRYTKKVTLSEEDLIKYRFSPKLYCYDKYGTVELWGMLLMVNNMTSCTEFKKRTFYDFRDSVFEIINEILIREETNIDKNKKDNDL